MNDAQQNFPEKLKACWHPVSYSIEIKKEKIEDVQKLKDVNKELLSLNETFKKFIDKNKIKDLLIKLKEINLRLWAIENDKRKAEKKNVFDENFRQLARNVYKTNDQRAEIKLKINDDSLIPGEDYLIEPGSVSCQGIFEVLEINLSNWKSFSLNKKNEDLCLLIDVSNVGNKDSLLIYNEIKKILNKKYPILWIGSEKLQWSVSQYTLSNAIIKLRPEIIKEEIKIVEIELIVCSAKSIPTNAQISIIYTTLDLKCR